MINKDIRDKYIAVIGLEVHAQLQTESKIFCSDMNGYGAEPNTHISPISLGHPGTLPKLNKRVVDYAIKMGLACHSEITRENVFARKNYFYPDLPKGYQITQDKAPICKGGFVSVKPKGQPDYRHIALNRIHMEEDAGKSIHMEGRTETAVDYNRAGVPLIEIVTEPDLRTSEEANLFLTEIRRLVRYLEICDGNMEQGSLRCDANVSVMLKDASTYGNKVEVKNMNSMRNVQRAIDHEIERQIKALENGEYIVSETRDFDAASGTTSSLRTKEALNDYRYFPDPDLSPLVVEEDWIKKLKLEMPPLPLELIHKFMNAYGLSEYEAEVLTDNKEMALYFDELCTISPYYKSAANWVMGVVKSHLNSENISAKDFGIAPIRLAELIALVEEGKLSNSTASQQVFPLLIANSQQTAIEVAEKHNLLQDSSSDNIQELVDEVIASMSDKVKAYKSGKKGLIGLFMGEVMKRSNGKADPKLANELLKNTLEKN